MHSPSESEPTGTETIKEIKPQAPTPELPLETLDKKALEEKRKALEENLKASFGAALTKVTEKKGVRCSPPDISIDPEKDIQDRYHYFGVNPLEDSGFTIHAIIYRSTETGSKGSWVITMTRSIFYDKNSHEWKALRRGIQVADELHGEGIASQVGAEEEKSYKEQGISEMLLSAGLTVGVYYNAQQGFDFALSEQKNQANARFLSFILEHHVNDVRIKGSKENIWPFKKEWSAYELSQMQTFDTHGKEILFTARRQKEEHEIEEIANHLITLCCPQGTHEKVKAYFKNGEFNPFSLAGMLNLKTRDERKKRYEHDLDANLNNKNIGNHQARAMGEEGKREYLELIQKESFREGFLNGIEELETEKILGSDGAPLSIFHQKHYSLGKALFLDMGPGNIFPHGWEGKKRL